MLEHSRPAESLPRRVGGYARLRDYAAIGDGRTVALVAKDGSVDWLCLPDLDSPAVFAALLDAGSGGRFSLRPEAPFEASQRYLPGTNVLETTFRGATGTVRVTDAMTLPTDALCPQRELVRVAEAIGGSLEMRWELVPRFGFAAKPTLTGRRPGAVVATQGSDALALCSFGAGAAHVEAGSLHGRFGLASGDQAALVLSCAHQEPLVIPGLAGAKARLAATVTAWREWAGKLRYAGAWRSAVVRSALALKLLVHAPSGAIAAAATTSLPEALGGERNWDYRFCWVRDSAFVLAALLRLGCAAEADAFFWWLMQASQLTHPRLRILYRLDGGTGAAERVVPLDGYRASAPVRIGNGAAGQVQLDVYGDLLQAAWLYSMAGRPIDADIARRLAETADLVCRIWDEPDAGLWEVRSGPQPFTQSKMMCWIALDRASQLARAGRIPSGHLARWDTTARAISAFIEENCWSEEKQAYVRHAGSGDLDAGVLLGVIFGYGARRHPRLRATVEALRRNLGRGPFVYRYSGEDGLTGREGAFLTCSFWLVEALAIQGRRAEAAELMDELVGLANDVGLFAEEVDPDTGEFLGNLPQGLTHLSLVNAAVTLTEGAER